jgi:hypothetical protein
MQAPTLEAQAEALFRDAPDMHLVALGGRRTASSLDTFPFGVRAGFLAAEDHPELCAQYLALNRLAFPRLPLPSWVLSDLYLLPGAIAIVRGRAERLPAHVRSGLGLAPDAVAILAAWVGVPTVEPGRFIGVSLLSFVPGLGAWAKAFGLRMLRARRLEGVAQWASPSLRTHTRMGYLHVIGRVPGGHELGASSFVYRTDLHRDEVWAAAMARVLHRPSVGVRWDDVGALSARLLAAENGEEVMIVPPGIDGQTVRFAR